MKIFGGKEKKRERSSPKDICRLVYDILEWKIDSLAGEYQAGTLLLRRTGKWGVVHIVVFLADSMQPVFDTRYYVDTGHAYPSIRYNYGPWVSELHELHEQALSEKHEDWYQRHNDL